MRPAISIIVPNYNHARFASVSLGEIARQMQPQDELIVIDDASQDDSPAVISRLIEDAPNARLLRHAENRGVLFSLNEGLGLARNPLICFPASDDRIGDNALAQAADLLMKHPQAAFCSGFARVIDDAGTTARPFPTRLVRAEPAYLPPNEVAAELMFDDSWIIGLALYRTDMLRAAGGFLAELSNFSDGFACRLLALRHGCCFVPAPFHFWRRASESLSSQETLDLQHALSIGTRAKRLMTEAYGEVFPQEYAQRWFNRWQFGARAFAIKTRQRRRWRKLLRMANELHPACGRTVNMARLLLLVPRLTWLFLLLRPHDVAAVLQRRLLGRHAN